MGLGGGLACVGAWTVWEGGVVALCCLGLESNILTGLIR